MSRTTSVDSLLFNGALKPRARNVITCGDEAAVVRAVRDAARDGAPVAVVGGGHDLWGRGLMGDNRVLDIGPLNAIDIAPSGDVATVSGGTLTRQLIEVLPDGIAAVTGTNQSVGVTGFTLGGGYGQLNARWGLAADNLLSARVVLADRSIVVADERRNRELFWALRGGGGGFGVVTSATLALHALPRVFTAMVLTPIGGAPRAISLVGELILEHPVELALFSGFVTGPDGRIAHFAVPMWTGGTDGGEAVVNRLASSPGSRVVSRRWSSYRATYDSEPETAPPKGAGYLVVTRTMRQLDDATIGLLVDVARRMPTSSDVVFIHDFHGAATGIAPDATAFPLREPHFVVEVIAITPMGSEGGQEAQQRWLEDVRAALSPSALPGGYVPLLGPGEAGRVRAFYGAAGERLRAIKKQIDPGDLFRSAVGRLG